jgi:hypothetical protein
MSLYYISGFAVGILFPHYLSNYHFEILQGSVLRPHLQFFQMRKNKLKSGIEITHEDYLFYLKNTFLSFYNMIHFFIIGEKRLFNLTKQKACFDLISDFEFIKETVDNYDYILENVKEIQNEILNNRLIEAKESQKTVEDYNFENIEIIKEMAKDDYEKYLIDNAVMRKDEYYKTLTPEFILQKEQNKLRMAEQYQNAYQEFDDERMGRNLLDSMKVARLKANELYEKKKVEQDKVKAMKTEEMKSQKVKVIEPLSKKYPTIKNIDKEIQTLKQIFGEK